jgi:Hypothetical protein (DUF2513)
MPDRRCYAAKTPNFMPPARLTVARSVPGTPPPRRTSTQIPRKNHFYQRQSIPNVGVDRITNWGHDFIRSVKDDTIWNKVKDEVIDTGKAFTLSMLIDYMKALAAEYL